MNAQLPGIPEMMSATEDSQPQGAASNLADFLKRSLRAAPHVIDSIGGTPLLPQEMIAQGERLAAELDEAGVGKGEPVHVHIANEPSDLAALLGVWSAGAVVVPIHHAAHDATIERIGRATAARFRVCGLVLERSDKAPPPDRPMLRQAGLIIFTSGTTGEPKGVVIGHRGLCEKIAVLTQLLKMNEKDVVAMPLSLTFVFGIWVSFVALAARARLVLLPKYSDRIMRDVLQSGVTVWAAVPTMLRSLLGEEELPSSGLRMILTGGESFGGELALKVQKAFPDAATFDLYGLTETTSCDFCLGPDETVAGRGSIGRPTQGVSYTIVTPEGRVAGPDISGELHIRSPYRMLGYLDDPQRTEQAFHEGYFKTGDIARQRADGFVELLGRSKEIIVRGGNKISPLEIDNVIASHPSISAALCAGVPDQRLGEIIHVAVVARPGCDVTAEILGEWAARHLERYKRPDKFHFVKELPVGRTGKANRAGISALAQHGEESLSGGS